MDEPTSALTAKEIDELFRIIRRLKDSGCGIVYISHRLEELQHIVDRVTIMRDEQYITSMNFADTTMADTMAQNPDVMGYEGVKAAVAALNGENLGGAVTDTGVSVLTK